MPILLFVLFALCGIGFYSREEADLHPAPTLVEPPSISADHAAWARACQARLSEAAREFQSGDHADCNTGEVTLSTLPSGVEYVEYNLRGNDGAVYQVTVTEEPQNGGESTGWRGAPGCHRGYDHGYEAVRHDNGRLALVSATSPRGLEFAERFAPATDFCIEQAQ